MADMGIIMAVKTGTVSEAFRPVYRECDEVTFIYHSANWELSHSGKVAAEPSGLDLLE
jgi:hypothetical protein